MAERPEVLGLEVLFEGKHPSVDIVAVHGLGATPDWAWTRKVKTGDTEAYVNWLEDKDMLPAKLPDSRIMTFGYESKWLLDSPKQRRYLCAISLLTALDNKRKEVTTPTSQMNESEKWQEKHTEHRPLIFIGHSFGGVVIEQSLVSANSSDRRFETLALSTVGVIFLGTPHRGTKIAHWGAIVASSAKALGFGLEDSILKDLREDSETLRDLLYEFTLWANRAQLTILCFFEQHETDYGKRFLGTYKELVVSETSACIDGYRKVALPTDHFKINKYSGPEDPSYLAVCPLIVDMTQNAIRIVEGRLNPQRIVENNSRIPNENLGCLQALFLSNPQDDLSAIRSAKGDRVHGTCEWILTQELYTSWSVEGSSQLLWLSGSPGIGKTMISSFIVEELALLAARSPQMTLAYYFCDDKNEGRRTATAILRGLLLQLLRQRPILFKHIQNDFNMSRDRLFADFDALWRIFASMVEDPEAGEVCCLIDALDECEKESRQTFLTSLTKFFCSQQSKKTPVKFIVTSRRESDIEESLSAVSPAIRNLQIDSGKINHDLSKFIDIKVDELCKIKKYTSGLKEKIRSALTEKAGGTFLYVSLVLHDLKKATISSQVTRKLKELPSDLNKVYDRILGQIDSDCEEDAKLVLCWVAIARRPLTMDELAMVRALSMAEWQTNTVPPKDLLDELKDGFKCCEPLVYVDTDNDTVNLVHQSAKDYLLGTYLQKMDNLSQYYVVTDRTNLHIFRTCWKYLGLEEFEQGRVVIDRDAANRLEYNSLSEQLLNHHCFLRYARYKWQEHALEAGPALTTDNEFWKDNLGKMPRLRGLWLLDAAEEGREAVVQRLLEYGAEPEVRDWLSRTALSCAARGGHEGTVNLLLSHGDVLADSRDQDGRTPLSLAVQRGRESIVKMLLSRDDVMADSQDDFGRTPLLYAAKTGYESIVKMLLSRDDVTADSSDNDGHTPLLYAAAEGHEVIVKLLLSRDDVIADSRNNVGQTPLFWAARRGHESITKLLLSRDDVMADSRDQAGQTPLSLAAERGLESIVKMLLSRDDVMIDSRDNYGQTPLSLAAWRGRESIVKMLLSQDDVMADSRDNSGQTPLLYAAKRGDESIVKMLLSRDDVTADARDTNGQTSLSLAAWRGRESIVRLLLSRDDVMADSRDNSGQTPLLYAARGGHEVIVKMLLSRDDVMADARDTNGQTSLSLAAWRGRESIVRLLLSRDDVMADSRDNSGQTPLLYAAREGHEVIVKMLLSRDDVMADSSDNDGQTPLSQATAEEHEAVVDLLKQKMRDASYTPRKRRIVEVLDD